MDEESVVDVPPESEAPAADNAEAPAPPPAEEEAAPPPAEEPKPPEEAPPPEAQPAEPPQEEAKPAEPAAPEETAPEPAPADQAVSEKRPSEGPQPEAAEEVKPSETVEERPSQVMQQPGLEPIPEEPKPEGEPRKSDVSKPEETVEAKEEGIIEEEETKSEKKSLPAKASEETVSPKTSLVKKLSGPPSLDKKPSGASSESLTKIQPSSREKVGRKSRSERLSSKAQKVLGSTISIRRLSTTGELYDKGKSAKYMNSYKLDADNPFNHEKVQKILEGVMVEALDNLTYDPDKCPKQAKWASSAIRAKVKELQFDRYKVICLVTIGEKNSQDVFVTCRFLWDTERDRYATYCLENTYVFGIAQCFGLYYE